MNKGLHQSSDEGLKLTWNISFKVTIHITNSVDKTKLVLKRKARTMYGLDGRSWTPRYHVLSIKGELFQNDAGKTRGAFCCLTINIWIIILYEEPLVPKISIASD